MSMDIYDRMKAGEPIKAGDPDFEKVLEGYARVMRLTSKMNTECHDYKGIRDLVSELTCSELSDDVQIIPPFYSDWG